MLGNHQLLTHRLRKSGKSCMATVVSYRRTMGMNESIQGGAPFAKSLCELTLRVEPQGEPPFEARTEAWLLGTEGTHEGMVVPVLYDPSDHSKVVVDQSDAGWNQAVTDNAIAERTARAVARGEDPARTAAIEQMSRAALADPEGFRKLMREQGPAAFGLPGVPATFPGTVAPAAAADPLDRLSKLADLHARGVLTDAEFETEKKKLLDE